MSIGNFSVMGLMVSYSAGGGPMRRFGMNPFPAEVGPQVHAALCELVASGAIVPRVGRRISMAEVASALDDHENRRTHGRTVVDIAGSR